MKEILLKPKKVTKQLLDELEAKGLITQLNYTKECLETKDPYGVVDLIYQTAPEFGPQKLICVAKKQLHIEMTVHGDKEELLMLNSTGKKFKPLYLIVAMDKTAVFNDKVKGGDLSENDVIAVELKYNDPETSVFVMNGDVPHCEVTAPGEGQHPLFFVTEPARLSFNVIPTPGYELKLKI